MAAFDSADLSREALRQIINGYQLAQGLYVAAELGIADWLKDGPRHFTEVAGLCHAHPNALFRLLRALASAGVFVQRDGDYFEMNEPARYLCCDTPDSLRAWAILSGQQFYPTWRNLLHSIKTGETAFDDLQGMNVWQFRALNPAAGRVFNVAMSDRTTSNVAAIVEAIDLQFECIVDVGGGQGTLLAAILQAHPVQRGVLFDQPQVIQDSLEFLAAAQVLDRCKIVAGSLLEAVPCEGDVFILKRILHDWDDSRAIQILKNCRRAMQATQTLFVVERVISQHNPTQEAALADLTMLVMNGGRERTEPDFHALFREAGFELTRLIPTRSAFQILEGHPV